MYKTLDSSQLEQHQIFRPNLPKIIRMIKLEKINIQSELQILGPNLSPKKLLTKILKK